MPSAEASGAICVQRFDGSRNSAIHTTYRISLRSSSIREPRYPLLRVVFGLWSGGTEAALPIASEWFGVWGVLRLDKITRQPAGAGHPARPGHRDEARARGLAPPLFPTEGVGWLPVWIRSIQ